MLTQENMVLYLIGHVGKDAELRHTPGGLKVANFTLAVNRTRKDTTDKDGNAKEPTEVTSWFRLACWNGLAEIAAAYVKKGRFLLVEVVLVPEPRIWVDEDGKPHAQYEGSVRGLKFLDRKPASGEPGNASTEVEGDDIPF